MVDSKEKIINVRLSSTKVKLNNKINICLEISEDFGFVNEAKILINTKNNGYIHEQKLMYLWTENNINFFTCNLTFENTGLYYFCLKIILNGQEKWIKYDQINNKAIITENNFQYWTITVYDSNFTTPNWAKEKVMYHVFVDRFCKSEAYNPVKMENRITKQWGEMPEWRVSENNRYNNIDFFMGNLKGIESKIPYLKKLGVKILYLSPIFTSQSNHRYDIADYENVDPYLGSNEHLKQLCVKAHRNGMKIVLDAVFNHTGNDSKYFNEYNSYKTVGAYKGPKSPYYNWYEKDQNGCFKYWWGFKNLPVCNGNSTEWQQFIYGKNGIIDKWFGLGIDGVRLDVADELTDEFIENIRIAVKRNKKDGLIIGEVWENAITKEKNGVQRKYLLGNGLDTVMNYPFTNAILKYVKFGDFTYFENVVKEILQQYPNDTISCLMNSLSTHDITRCITTLVGKGIEEKNELIWDVNYDREWQLQNEKLTNTQYQKGKKMFKIAAVIQYFLPGNACIYYGDEIGMYGYRDPFNRKCFEWNNIDEELYNFFIKLGQIKNDTFFEDAYFKIDYINNNLLIFERFNEEDRYTFFVNRAEKSAELDGIETRGNVVYQENCNENLMLGYGFKIIRNKIAKNKNNK